MKFFREFVLNKIKTVKHIVKLEGVENVGLLIIFLQIKFVYPKNLDVFIKDNSVPIVIILLNIIKFEKLVKLKDVYKKVTKDAKIVNILSNQQKMDYVKFLNVQM